MSARQLAVWLVMNGLQAWAQRVPGSFSGQTESGAGLLLVPVYSEVPETIRALQRFLDSALRTLGVASTAGSWAWRVIGPLSPGNASHVQKQLAQAGWPVS